MKCNLAQERASSQIQINQHRHLRWQSSRAWKQCLAWFWIDSNQSLQPICRKWNAKFEIHVSDQLRQEELQFSIWRFFKQFVFVINHLLCYWPTFHNPISKICPKFQVLSSHLFEVDKLLDVQWAKIVLSENISTQVTPSLCQMR